MSRYVFVSRETEIYFRDAKKYMPTLKNYSINEKISINVIYKLQKL